MNNAITLSSAALSTIPFASFAWAARKHFVCPGPMPHAMRALTFFNAAVYASFLAFLALRASPPDLFETIAGQIAFCSATMVFWWAVGTTSTIGLRIAYQKGSTDDIVSTGPYALVRHPFYTAYLLFWIGTGLLAGAWQWIPVLLMVVWYARIARSEERRLSQSNHSAAYADYRQRTGMFIPSIWR